MPTPIYIIHGRAAPHASLHATHSGHLRNTLPSGHTHRSNTRIQCGASVSSVEARERKVEEDECTEEITFKHVCKSCGHVICEHYHSFSFDDKHQDYMMECVLCGKGVDQILIDPTNGGDDGGAGVLSAAAGGAGGGAGGGGGETKGADRDMGVEEDIEEIRRAVQEVVTGANVPGDVVGGAVVEKGGGPVAAAAALNLIDSSPLMQQQQQAAAAAADAAAAKAAQGGGANEGDDSDDGGWDD